MNELPNREDFLKHLNTKFRVFFDGVQPTEVELTEVSELRQKPRYEAYSLVFLAPKTIPPMQMLYRVEHDALGTMDLFLVPFEETENSFAFEALFNQKITVASD
jgi:hypothetical protein